MGGVLLAIQAASALLTLIGNATAAAQQINATIAAAQAAGRDLTNDELDVAIAARKAAEAALLATLSATAPSTPAGA